MEGKLPSGKEIIYMEDIRDYLEVIEKIKKEYNVSVKPLEEKVAKLLDMDLVYISKRM